MVKYYISSDKSDYLKHEGIKGQKWGQRNGPPYPLTAKQFSKAEKRADAVVSRWTAKANKETQKANKQIANAKSDRKLNKALYKTMKAHAWVNEANRLNDMENPYIRKKGETKKEQKKRINEAADAFDYLNNHYTSTAVLALTTASSNYVVNRQLFKDYAYVYMKQPADAFVEESKKK